MTRNSRNPRTLVLATSVRNLSDLSCCWKPLDGAGDCDQREWAVSGRARSLGQPFVVQEVI